MRIDQTTPVRQLPTNAAPLAQPLSTTDWKTHALVVLGYVLVAIGIALAFCAPYIAFTVQPMLAVTSPVLPIALGVLGIQYASEPLSPTKVAAPVKPSNVVAVPPMGIRREGNNCWVNASLQIIFNVPVFKRLLENLNNPSDQVLIEIKAAFETYKQRGEVDSQKIRKLLPNLDRHIDPSSRAPDDPILLLSPLLKKLGYPSLEEYEYCVRREKGEFVSINRSKNKDNPVYLDLTSHFDEKRNRMTDILNAHFDHAFENKHPEKNIVLHTDHNIRFLKDVPEDITIAIHPKFPEDSGERVDKVVKDAMEVSIERHRYFCDSFITHYGSSFQHGHYIGYLYKDGTWWEVNDDLVKSIKPEIASRLLATAYLRHYQRVPSNQMIT